MNTQSHMAEDIGSSEELEDSQDDEEDLSEVSDDQYEEKTWIEWFCSGHEFFSEVEEDFIRDDFNLTGLSHLSMYDKALDMILDNDEDEPCCDSELEGLDMASSQLYGLIHARFIVTTRGLQMTQQKFATGVYGVCPNMFCGGQHVLPIGVSDHPNLYFCNIFCPKCRVSKHELWEGSVC
eukprot:GHVQ01021953.1.p1 GENE.GHVQ01021953.1~~GHVQ01021953.1.p1  ORF type:complete len:180 (+),score=21.20 GHVQ01021953.1:331-870(+)